MFGMLTSQTSLIQSLRSSACPCLFSNGMSCGVSELHRCRHPSCCRWLVSRATGSSFHPNLTVSSVTHGQSSRTFLAILFTPASTFWQKPNIRQCRDLLLLLLASTSAPAVGPPAVMPTSQPQQHRWRRKSSRTTHLPSSSLIERSRGCDIRTGPTGAAGPPHSQWTAPRPHWAADPEWPFQFCSSVGWYCSSKPCCQGCNNSGSVAVAH